MILSPIAVPGAPKRTAFVRNADLLTEIAISKTNGRVTDALARLLLLMATRFFLRGNYRYYSYVEELKCEALVQMTAAVMKFNSERSSNPFAYLTTVMVNAANKVLNHEKKMQLIRDELLMQEGHQPSYTASMANEDSFNDDLPNGWTTKRPGRPRKTHDQA